MIKKLLLLLLLINIAFANGIENAKIVSSIEGTVVDSGKVYAINSNFLSIDLNHSIPQTTSNQIVTYSGTTVKDDEGNSFANLKVSNPSNPYSYSIVSSIKITSRTTKDLPSSYSIPPEYGIYTRPSPEAQSDSKEIKDLAKVITANSVDDYERVAKLAIWVHNYITYDISLVGETKDASWVLENKKGVCVEYATLFTALSRSLGIPTKFVNGYSYSQFNNWLGHQWAEAYVGKWIPVDPTWLEVGHLDATHVEVFKSYKRDQPNWVYAYLSNNNGQLQWESDLKFGGDANNVRINKVEFEKPLDIEIKSSGTQLNFGDKALIFVKIKSKDYRVAEFELLPCSGEPKIITTEESKKYAILRNNEELIVPWVVDVSRNLDPSYEYTCPVTVYSAYSGSNVLTLEAIKQKSGKTYFNAWLGRNVLSLGEEQTIFYQPTSVSTYSQIGYVYDYSESSREITGGDSGSFTFKPKKLGLNKVYVYSTTGDVKELKFNVISNSSLIIKNVSVQDFVAVGSNASVNVTITNKAKASAKVKLTVKIDEAEATQLIDLIGEKYLNFVIPTTTSGTRNVSISAEANDIRLEQNSIITVYEIPTVKLEGVKYQSAGNRTRVLLNLQTANEPREIILKVDNSEFIGKEGVNEIELIPGKYSLRIQWKDIAGKEYFSEQEIEVKKQNAFDDVIMPCLPLLALLAIILLAKRDL